MKAAKNSTDRIERLQASKPASAVLVSGEEETKIGVGVIGKITELLTISHSF